MFQHSHYTELPPENYHHITDLELVEHLSKDEMGAFDELYNRYWEKLYQFAFKIFRDDEICRDIIQEVFLDIWRRRHELKIRHVSSFMYQMTKFQVANQIRKSKTRKAYLETMNEVSFVYHVLEQVEFNELNSYLSETMAELPEKCRTVFYMSRFENLSNKEIGEKMNISVSTVEKHIHKALKFIRSSLHRFQ